MRIIVVGATGTLGKATAEALEKNNDIIKASRKGDIQVDLSSPETIREMYEKISDIDAIVCTAGEARFGSLESFAQEDFDFKRAQAALQRALARLKVAQGRTM